MCFNLKYIFVINILPYRLSKTLTMYTFMMVIVHNHLNLELEYTVDKNQPSPSQAPATICLSNLHQMVPNLSKDSMPFLSSMRSSASETMDFVLIRTFVMLMKAVAVLIVIVPLVLNVALTIVILNWVSKVASIAVTILMEIR